MLAPSQVSVVNEQNENELRVANLNVAIGGNIGIRIVHQTDTGVVELSGRVTLVETVVREVHGISVHDIRSTGCQAIARR